MGHFTVAIRDYQDGQIRRLVLPLSETIEPDVVRVFTTGHCAALALRIHELSGAPLVAVAPVGEVPRVDNGGVCHVAVTPAGAGPDEILDILGRRTISETEWADYDSQLMTTQAGLEPISRETVEALIAAFNRDLELPPKAVEHYARILVARHLT